MKFKIDENLPFSIKRIIENSGDHLVDSVYHEHLVGTEDKLLIQHCFTEKRVLITLETDFKKDEILKKQKIFGIILLRPETQGKKAVNLLINKLIENYNLNDLKDKILIVENSQIKIRTF